VSFKQFLLGVLVFVEKHYSVDSTCNHGMHVNTSWSNVDDIELYFVEWIWHKERSMADIARLMAPVLFIWQYAIPNELLHGFMIYFQN
jgi:hypothetical protein